MNDTGMTFPTSMNFIEDLLVLDDEQFVRAAYLALLGRHADSEGLESYVGHIRSGRDKREVIVDLALSEEGRAIATDVPGLRELLEGSSRRPPLNEDLMKDLTTLGPIRSQPGGIPSRMTSVLPHSARVSGQATPRKTSKSAILHVDELLQRHDATFVAAAYQALLGRAPDAEGMHFYVARIRNGISKIQILAEMRNSPEGKSRSREVIGLDERIRYNAWLLIPVIGALLRALGFGMKEPPTRQRLRALENQLSALNEQLQTRNAPGPENLGDLVEANGPQMKVVTPHARDVYRQLKIAATIRERR